MLTCTWWTCSIEKSLLKQALNMGMDEGWTNRLLPGGEPPPWSALSSESSVPFEVWLTESQMISKFHSIIEIEFQYKFPNKDEMIKNYFCHQVVKHLKLIIDVV